MDFDAAYRVDFDAAGEDVADEDVADKDVADEDVADEDVADKDVADEDVVLADHGSDTDSKFPAWSFVDSYHGTTCGSGQWSHPRCLNREDPCYDQDAPSQWTIHRDASPSSCDRRTHHVAYFLFDVC